MSIRLALCTAACPDKTIDQVIQLAADMGYQGLDFTTRFGKKTPDFQCDIQQGDATAIREALAKANITPVCVSTNISLVTEDQQQGDAALAMVRHAGKRAAEIGATSLRVLAWDPQQSRHPQAVMTRMAILARQAADELAVMGVQLLFENLGSLSQARDWWACLEAISHPMIGLYWNATSSALVNQSPAVWAPMLNSRIRNVRLTDFRIDKHQILPVPLGQGELPVGQIMHRLRGVGYPHFVTVHWDRLAMPSLAADESILANARTMLAGMAENAPPAPTKPARPAAKPAGKAVAAKSSAKTASDSPKENAAKEATADSKSDDVNATDTKPDPRAAALARIAAMREKRANEKQQDQSSGTPKASASAESKDEENTGNAAGSKVESSQTPSASGKAEPSTQDQSIEAKSEEAKSGPAGDPDPKAAAREAAKARMEQIRQQRAQAKQNTSPEPDQA